jgi:tRNA(fMet)-specific endonuclease VapC
MQVIGSESMACLDTTVIIDLVGHRGRRKRDRAEAALRRLDHDRPHSITRFTMAELLVGAELSTDPARERAAFDRLLTRLQILDFDSRAMRIYVIVFARLTRMGLRTGAMDMLIASVAMANGQRFLTRNRSHFEVVPGLRVLTYQ